MEQPTNEGLVRAIRRWDLVALALNAIVGAGIFGLPSEVFRRLGAWSLFAFLVCGFVVTLIILCFAEVSSRFTGTGGPYLYARETFGPLVGFQVGWLIWIARITAFAANCNLLIGYLGYFWPGAESPAPRVMLIGVVVFGLTAVNLLGVRNATQASNIFTVSKLLPLLLFVGVGIFALDTSHYSFAARPPFGEFSASVLLLVYAFSGFEMATISGGEARNPRADLPRALLYAMGLVVVLYVLIQLVAIGTLPGLAGSARPLADAGGRFLGPWGATLITTGAVVSILGNLNVIMMAGSRLPFAMAKGGQLPRFIAATHPRFRTPHVSIVVTAGAALLLTLSGTFVYAATISVIARLLSYAATCAALPVLRRREDAPAAMFRAPAGVAVSVVALVLVGWLLSHSTLRQARDAGIAAVAGLLLYLVPLVMRRRAHGS
jgi:amino acid transporter